MPSKKHLALLEEHGIISKKKGGNVFKDIGKATKSAVKATEKATKCAVKSTGKAVKYVGDYEKDIRKIIKNPIVKGAILGATSLVAPELDPLVAVALSAAGKAKKAPSKWVQFVMDYSKKKI